MARRLPDVDAVVAVGGMARNSFVFFVECVHGWPGERNSSLQLARVDRQVHMLPCSSTCPLAPRLDGIPRCDSKIGMPGRMLGAFEHVGRDVGLWEVGNWIVARLKQQQDVLAIGDPVSA